ncbi:hypothetical protein RB594_003413 [Gaeumannomyces avenae]
MSSRTNDQWVVKGSEKGFDELEYQKNVPVPNVGEHDVLVRLHGASLNYRDLIITKGMYPFPLNLPVVPASDGAGEVVSVGPRVTRFKPGDRVVTLFNQGHQSGPLTAASAQTGLGGVLPGTLRRWGVFGEDGLVRAPRNLSHLEAASLPCAALTAWNALYGLRPVKPGDVVLVQGTGGVSVFALQFAKTAGATVIATTSSADKAEVVRRLGADHVINYKEDRGWGETARGLTRDGAGVDYVVEVGGLGTFEQSLKAIKFEGIITVIGFLSGAHGEKFPPAIESLVRVCTIRGLLVGSRAMMEDMVAAIEANDIHPVLDKKVFTLEQAREAYDYMWAQSHFGKLAIKIE